MNLSLSLSLILIIHTHTHLYREREREKGKDFYSNVYMCFTVYMYWFLCMRFSMVIIIDRIKFIGGVCVSSCMWEYNCASHKNMRISPRPTYIFSKYAPQLYYLLDWNTFNLCIIYAIQLLFLSILSTFFAHSKWYKDFFHFQKKNRSMQA